MRRAARQHEQSRPSRSRLTGPIGSCVSSFSDARGGPKASGVDPDRAVIVGMEVEFMQLRMAVSVAVYVLMIAACVGDDGASLDPMSPVPPAITATSPTSVGSSTTATRPSTTPTEPMMIVEAEVRARDGQALPDSGTVVITWVVSAGPEDYVFVYGMGTQRGAEFVVQLDAPPPAEALNNATLGVGVVLLVPGDSAVTEGRIEGREFEEGALEVVGGAGRYAVIYRAGEEPGLAWPMSSRSVLAAVAVSTQ
jgi:hypothetical protein